MGLPGSATAGAGKCPEWAARVVSIEGRVEALSAGTSQWQAVALNDTFCPEDQIRTLENSRAAVQLSNETMLRLDQNTLVKFSATTPESPSLLEIFTGRALFMTRFPHPLTIDTPYVNASSGGTEYVIEVDKAHQTSTLTVIEGTMHLKNAQGTLTVTDGQSSVTHAGTGPELQVVVNVKDVLHWALYYPPVLNLHDLHLGETKALPASDWRAMVAKSIAAYQSGDLAQSFAALENAPANIDDPRFYDYRASLLLAVGRLGQAQADIKQALTLAPQNGLALALQSLIAVVQNQADKALSLAQEAADAEPESSSVRIALSYAWQANFNLPQALTAAQDATRLDPKASLAWARTAELWLSQGYLSEALDAAKRAEALNPREARVQTILGFAYLTQIKIKQAQAAFEHGIALNSSDPLSRLGLGLAKIRQGKLADGRQEIEIAATLDPGNALIRSYLGKAYYEEKRGGKAAIQFNLAKKLDPKDPTPYSYDAVMKQTRNRPVEALHDEQTAIALNDNRAVYRSRLLLDEDLSSRSVSQGRIAVDLGFGQLALSEGWKSVNADPTNYSAQRFLADNYAALPNSEIARQSALLLSQLLQPLNTNPVQPSLTDRSAVSPGTSPTNPAYNEYSQLFDRNQARLIASGIVGNHNTLGDEVIATGLYDRYSLSVGQYRLRTDGYRENAGLDQKIFDSFVQVALTPKLSIQGEARSNKTQNGDLGLRFDPDFYSRTLTVNTDIDVYRLGLHYAASPTSDFILTNSYQAYEERQNEPGPVNDINIRTRDIQKSHNSEGQYLYHSAPLSLMVGGDRYAGPETISQNVTFNDPTGAIVPIIDRSDENRIHHYNIYVYSLISPQENITLTLGGSFDRATTRQLLPLKREQFNPKLGLTWNITTSTTLRLAGLRSLRRYLVSNQTIEPTQVAGFQQFFDEYAFGTDSKLYGIGIDQKFNAGLFGGIEDTRRDLTVPVFIDNNADLIFDSVDEQEMRIHKGRAYLYWTPTAQVAASIEYFYDRRDGGTFNSNFTRLTTHRIPLGLRFYLPSGFFVKVKPTFVYQKGDFSSSSSGTGISGKSTFWVADAEVGYRLPRRVGIVTVGCNNIFDRQFKMNDVDNIASSPSQYPQIQPGRFGFAKLTIAF